MEIDEGVLSNKSQLPVSKLSYGGSENRFSWILFKLGFLRCFGKDENAVYPSEAYESRINSIEENVANLEERANQPDYYFQYNSGSK